MRKHADVNLRMVMAMWNIGKGYEGIKGFCIIFDWFVERLFLFTVTPSMINGMKDTMLLVILITRACSFNGRCSRTTFLEKEHC